MYSDITHNIKVTVIPAYLEEHSSPSENHFVWAYTIELENQGKEPVQLISRYWHITDADGRVQEVRGDGVVGEQPIIHPGKSYQYTSGAALSSPSGIMVGSYQMTVNNGQQMIDVSIPAFSLDSPHQAASIN